jgi:glycosyltransferase involved in cell wall biosynthesis
LKLGDGRKTILVVSQYFWPEDFRVNELVIGLKENGYNVEVLTGRPNYPSGITFKDFKENPKQFSAYQDIKIHRVWQFSRGKSKLGLLVNYLSFVLTSCLYSLFKLRRNTYDIVFAVQLSPIFSVIPAILCKKIFGIPLHLWVLDIWPDSVASTGINRKGFLYISLDNLCRAIYSSADVLFLSSSGFKKRLIDMKVSGPKFVNLPQWVESIYTHDIEFGRQIDSEVKEILSPWSEKKIFLFAGNIGEAQDFPSILSGFKNSDCLDELVFLILGDGRYKDTVLEKIDSYELPGHVFYLGRYPAEYMPLFYYYADFLVFSLMDVPIFALTLPGKIQSYMSSGTPIIGMVNGEAAAVIKEAKCGFTVPSGDAQGFSNLLNNCCSEPSESMNVLGKNGKEYADRNYNFGMLIAKVARFF